MPLSQPPALPDPCIPDVLKVGSYLYTRKGAGDHQTAFTYLGPYNSTLVLVYDPYRKLFGVSITLASPNLSSCLRCSARLDPDKSFEAQVAFEIDNTLLGLLHKVPSVMPDDFRSFSWLFQQGRSEAHLATAYDVWPTVELLASASPSQRRSASIKVSAKHRTGGYGVKDDNVARIGREIERLQELFPAQGVPRPRKRKIPTT